MTLKTVAPPIYEYSVTESRKHIYHFWCESQAIDFMFAIGMRESGYLYYNIPPNPGIVNKYGYRGMFQFGYAALVETGYNHVYLRKFIKNPEMWPLDQQYDAMKKLLDKNYSYLKKYIEKYDGDTIRGIPITKTGIIASAHLLGASRVKKYLTRRGRYNPRDGFKTSLSEYMLLFSEYNYEPEYIDSNVFNYKHHENLCNMVKEGEWEFKEKRDVFLW